MIGTGVGVYCAAESSPTLRNCTIAGNEPGIFAIGGGLRCLDGSVLTATSCIVWGNGPYPLDFAEGSAPNITFSCLEEAFAGEGNINADPAFVDVAGNDYHLAAASPCIDAGTAAGAPSTDIEGRARPCGAAVDIGAYEFGDCGGAVRFRRADSNADGTLDLSDAVAVLGYLFLGTEDLPCLDAADADDSGKVDISDAIYSLGFLFLGGPAPPAPFAACGVDATEDDLGCESFAACP